MGRGIDEVTEPQESRAETHGGPIHSTHQDLRVSVERPRDVEVVGHEPAHDFPSRFVGGHAICVGRVRGGTGRGNICTRGEESACPCENRDDCFWVVGEGAKEAGDAVIVGLGDCVEFGGAVECDDADAAFDLEGYLFFEFGGDLAEGHGSAGCGV